MASFDAETVRHALETARRHSIHEVVLQSGDASFHAVLKPVKAKARLGSVALGMALSGRRRGRSYRVYVILGDGELQEGQVWEAALAAGSFGVGNLCVILDLNRMQVEGAASAVDALRAGGRADGVFGGGPVVGAEPVGRPLVDVPGHVEESERSARERLHRTGRAAWR